MKPKTTNNLTLFALIVAIPSTITTDNQALVRTDRAELDYSFMANSNSWMTQLVESNKKGADYGK